MSDIVGKPVILVTFAGRRDRMELLSRYVAEAMRRNLVDEWHVWNFARNDEDDKWLRDRFTVVGRTPDDLIYYPAGQLDVGPDHRWRSRIRAGNDVHIAVKPRDGAPGAQAFEFVVGGWDNHRTVLRSVDSDDLLVRDDRDRRTTRPPVAAVDTPGILSGTAFRDVEVSLGPTGPTLSVDGAELITFDTPVEAGIHDVYVKTGYGTDGEWRFPDKGIAREFLYHNNEEPGAGWGAMYQFYIAGSVYHEDTVFLKCDDDIVYMQLDSLEEFLRFRIREEQYFLVSANVVNNNVCAYFQQKHGAIPRSLMELELPPGGFGGRLWQSGELAELLHYHFLDNLDDFERMPAEPIEWIRRLSINCVAWLGRDLSYMSRIVDDENTLSVEIPAYLKRPNCIYPRFLASHLSYNTQEGSLDVAGLISKYLEYAEKQGFPERIG
ncbi:hypothetical protein [Nocardia testacea]|uniref:Farnesoic acid O-methyl transferase domain-containing protein n=1 Tax=Nocardia testacea TaxID=248551 RepID=A0ABW7W1N7_9NOCA